MRSQKTDACKTTYKASGSHWFSRLPVAATSVQPAKPLLPHVHLPLRHGFLRGGELCSQCSMNHETLAAVKQNASRMTLGAHCPSLPQRTGETTTG
jgi:hypothetical protein